MFKIKHDESKNNILAKDIKLSKEEFKFKNGTLRNIQNFFKHFKMKDLKVWYGEQPAISIVRLIDENDYSYASEFFKNYIPTIVDTSALTDEQLDVWYNKISLLIEKLNGRIEIIGECLFILVPEGNTYQEQDEITYTKHVDKRGIPYELHGNTKIYNFKDINRLK